MMETLLSWIGTHGGVTYDARTDSVKADGYAVSIYPDRGVVISMATAKTGDIVRYLRSNADLLSQVGNYFGAWVDQGRLYLDVSAVTFSLRTAAQLMIVHGQQAIYNLATGEEYDREYCERYLNQLESVR